MSMRLSPYPKYKESGLPWLGKIPIHWDVRRLKQAFKHIVGGSTPSSAIARYWDGDIVWITPSDVSKEERLTNSFRKITQEGLASCSSVLVPKGSIIVTSRAPVGNVALADIELCTNQGCKALVPSDSVINPVFGYSVLCVLKDEMQGLATGTTFTEISTGKLGVVSMPLPPLPEQSAIVQFLDQSDRRISRFFRAKQKLIKLLEEQKQVVIHRAVARGLNPNVHLKPSGLEWLGNVPEHWEVLRAKYILREVDTRSTTGSETHLSMSQKHGLIPSSLIKEKRLVSESYTGGKLCEKDDVVLNRLKAHLGVFAVATERGVVSPDYTVLRAVRPINPRYFEFVLRSPACRIELRKRAKGIVQGFWRLYTDDFYDIVLPVPPLPEQDRIISDLAQELRQANTAIDRANREIDLLREYRNRLIFDVVTGKLDVRGVELPELEEDGALEEMAPDEVAEAEEIADDAMEGADA